MDLLEGINHLFLQVVREDERAPEPTITYLLTVCNAVDCHAQPDALTPTAQLRSLHVPSVNLTPAFAPATFAYAGLTTRHTHGAVLVPTLLQPSSDALIVASMNGDTFTSIASAGAATPCP